MAASSAPRPRGRRHDVGALGSVKSFLKNCKHSSQLGGGKDDEVKRLAPTKAISSTYSSKGVGKADKA